jgi:hypothetical protein
MSNRYQWPIAVAIAYAVFASPMPSALGSIYWGGENPLAEDQIATVQYLAWPQSLDAMRFLGVPAYRDASADWYRLPEGGFLRVDYNASGYAVGYGWERR